MRSDLQELLKRIEEISEEELTTTREQLFKKSQQLSLNKSEKLFFEKQFKQLRDIIADKKDKAFSALSLEQQQSLEHLYQLCEEKKERRLEVKEQLENYRRALGISGFDFEKAMMYREHIDAEKERLDKANADIIELEKKIAELEG